MSALDLLVAYCEINGRRLIVTVTPGEASFVEVMSDAADMIPSRISRRAMTVERAAALVASDLGIEVTA